MANSYTTTYSLTKPEVGAAEDQWGDLLNTNFDAIDDILDGTTPVTGIDINGGTIDGVTIGATSAPTVTNLGSVATADINGGTIDGTVIGGTTPAAITGTTLTATSSATLQHSASTKLATTSTGVDVTGTVTADGLTVEAVSDPTLQIKSTKDGTWAIGEALGSLDFYSSDSSGVGAGVKSSITSIAESTGGTIYGMGLFTYDGSSLYERLRVAYNGDISFYEDTGTTPKLFWDASAEALGIGTTSPTNILTVSTNGSTTPAINTFNAGNAAPITSYSARAGLELISYQSASGSPYTKTSALIANSDGTVPSEMQFWTKTNGQSSPAERLRIDSSGSLLLAKTSSNIGTVGLEADANGYTKITRSSGTADVNTVLLLNRLTTDGPILDLRKDGTTVGSFSAGAADNLFRISGSGTQIISLQRNGSDRYIVGNNTFYPFHDNLRDLGAVSSRWDDVYATNGTIQTSDRNEKQDIAELDEAEKRVAVAAKGLIRKYRWKDAVAEKGDDARIHVGIIAQDLQAAFEAEGLDAGRYAMFISSTWWEADEVIPAVEAVEAVDAVYEDVVIPAVLDEEGNEVEPERTEQRLVSEAIEAVEAQPERTVTRHYETAEEAPEGATERTRLGVRYPELLAFIIGAL